jgi:hypothetical protein
MNRGLKQLTCGLAIAAAVLGSVVLVIRFAGLFYLRGRHVEALAKVIEALPFPEVDRAMRTVLRDSSADGGRILHFPESVESTNYMSAYYIGGTTMIRIQYENEDIRQVVVRKPEYR